MAKKKTYEDFLKDTGSSNTTTQKGKVSFDQFIKDTGSAASTTYQSSQTRSANAKKQKSESTSQSNRINSTIRDYQNNAASAVSNIMGTQSATNKAIKKENEKTVSDSLPTQYTQEDYTNTLKFVSKNMGTNDIFRGTSVYDYDSAIELAKQKAENKRNKASIWEKAAENLSGIVGNGDYGYQSAIPFTVSEEKKKSYNNLQQDYENLVDEKEAVENGTYGDYISSKNGSQQTDAEKNRSLAHYHLDNMSSDGSKSAQSVVDTMNEIERQASSAEYVSDYNTAFASGEKDADSPRLRALKEHGYSDEQAEYINKNWDAFKSTLEAEAYESKRNEKIDNIVNDYGQDTYDLIAEYADANDGQQTAGSIARANDLKNKIEARGVSEEDLPYYEQYVREAENKKKTQERTSKIQKDIDKGWGNTIGYNAADIASSAVQGVLAAGETAKKYVGVGYADKEAPVDVYSDLYALQNAGEATQNATSNKLSESIYNATGSKDMANVATFAYGALDSAAKSTTQMELGGIIGASFGTGETAANVAKLVTNVSFSTSAYSSTLKQNLEKGIGEKQATQSAVAAGIAEAMFEEMSLDKLYSDHEVKNFIGDLLVQAGIEGSEEVFTDLSNALTDFAINGAYSEWQENVRTGGTEYAAQQLGAQVLQSGLAGALSGALSIGVGKAKGLYGYNKGVNNISKVMVNYSDSTAEALSELDDSKFTSAEAVEKKNELIEEVSGLSDTEDETAGKKAAQTLLELSNEYNGDIFEDINSSIEATAEVKQSEQKKEATQKMGTAIAKSQYTMRTPESAEEAGKNILNAETPDDVRIAYDASQASENGQIRAAGQEALQALRTGLQSDNGNIKKDFDIDDLNIAMSATSAMEAYNMAIEGKEIDASTLTAKGKEAVALAKDVKEGATAKLKTKSKDVANASVVLRGGSQASVNGIKERDGELMLTTTDGRTISADDVKFQNSTVGEIYNYAMSLPSEALAQAVISNYSTGTAFGSYKGAVDTFYDLGRTHSDTKTFEDYLKDEKNRLYAKNISEDLLRTAYNEGAKENSQENRKAITKATRKSTGKVITTSLTEDEIEDNKAMIGLAEMVAKQTGLDIEIGHTNTNENGYLAAESARVFLGLNSDAFKTLFHEAYGEFAEAWNNAGMQEVQEQVLNYLIRKNGASKVTKRIRQYMDVYRRSGGKLDQNKSFREAANELVNDTLAELFQTEAGMTSLYDELTQNEGASVAHKTFSSIMDFIDKVTGIIRSYFKNGNAGNALSMNLSLEEADALRQKLYDVIQAASENMQNAEISETVSGKRNSKNVDEGYYIDENGITIVTSMQVTKSQMYKNANEMAEMIKDQLANRINDSFVIKEDGSKVYVGTDFAEEYTSSGSTQKLGRDERRAKFNATKALDSIIENAKVPEEEKLRWQENDEIKHALDAKRGWRIYYITFGTKSADGITYFTGRLKVRMDADGKDYIYDIIKFHKKRGVATALPSDKMRTVKVDTQTKEIIPQGSKYARKSMNVLDSIINDSETESEKEAKEFLGTTAYTANDLKSRRSSLAMDDDLMKKSIKANNKFGGKVDYMTLNRAQATRKIVANGLRRYQQYLPEDVAGNIVVSNGSYSRSVENSLICVRSLVSNYFADMVSEMVGKPLSVEEQIIASQVLANLTDDQTECSYCYVATDRKTYRATFNEYYKQYKDVFDKVQKNPEKYRKNSSYGYKEFLNGRKDTDPMRERYKHFVQDALSGKASLQLSDLTTAAKRAGLKGRGQLGWLVNDAEKYSKGAAWPKNTNRRVKINGHYRYLEYVAYNGNILGWKQSVIDDLNSEYGLRMYSDSDYVPAFLLENMQVVTDAAVRGLKMLAYTKDVGFARVFAPTGMGINISCFGYYDEKTGTYQQDGMMGADWKEAQACRAENPNVGVVFVATNDKMVDWALDQDWIDVVIPYHLVRTGDAVAKWYGYKNFKSQQEDKKIKGAWNKEQNLKSIPPTIHGNNKEKYLQALKDNNLTARFEQWIYNPNYMKLVNETRMAYTDMHAVQPEFDLGEAQKELARIPREGAYGMLKGLDSAEQQDELLKGYADEATDRINRYTELKKNMSEDEATERLKEEYEGRTRKSLDVEIEAVEKFGITDDFESAGFILSDGSMIDFTANKKGGGRDYDHRAIALAYGIKIDLNKNHGFNDEASPYLEEFIEDGAIRLDVGSMDLNLDTGMQLSSKAPLTEGQEETIRRFIEWKNDREKNYTPEDEWSLYENPLALRIEFGGDAEYSVGEKEDNLNAWGVKHLSYYGDHINPDRVISDIKNYYETGETRQQSDVARFHASYSLNIDSDGNKLSEGQQEYFQNSQIRDEKGKLLKVYHGSDSRFTVFDKSKIREGNWFGKGFYFAENEDYAKLYKRNILGKVYESYLNITNPLIVEGRTPESLKEYASVNYPEATYSSDMYTFARNIGIAGYDLAEYAKEEGNDGIWVKGREIVTFESEQAKLTSNLNPTSSKNIRRSINVDGGFLDNYRHSYDDLSWMEDDSDISDVFTGMDEYKTTHEAQTNVNKVLTTVNNLLKGATVSDYVLDRTVAALKKNYSSDINSEDLKAMLKDTFDYMQQAEEIDTDDLVYQLMAVGKELIDQAYDYSQYDVETFDKFKEAVGSHAIKVSDRQKAELISRYDNWNAARAAMRKAGFKIDKNGTNTDRGFYEEIVDAAAELGYTMETDQNDLDQILNVIEAADALRPVAQNPFNGNETEAAMEAAMSILSTYYTEQLDELKSTPDVKEQVKKQAAKLRGENAQYKKQIKAEYEQRYKEQVRIAQDMADARADKLSRDLAKARAEHAKAIKEKDEITKLEIQKTMQQYTDQLEKIKQKQKDFNAKQIEREKQRQQAARAAYHKSVDNKRRTEMRHKIMKVYKELNSMLEHPNKKSYIPANSPEGNLLDAAIKTLQAINLDRGTSKELYKYLEHMADVYRTFEESQSAGFDTPFDDRIQSDLDELLYIFSGRNYTELSLEELTRVYEIERKLITKIRNADKLIENERKEKASKIAESSVSEVKKSRIYQNRFVKMFENYFTKQLTADSFFRRTSGFRTDSAWYSMYDELKQGQRKQLMVMRDVMSIFDDVLKGSKNKKALKELRSTKKENMVDVGIRDSEGNAVLVTKAMRLSIIMHSKNRANMMHMLYGGLTVPNMELYGKGKYDEAFDRNNGAITYPYIRYNDLLIAYQTGNFTEVERQEQEAQKIFKNLENNLSDYEKKFLKDAEEMFWNYTGKQINETSQELNGYVIARVKKYFPIKTDGKFTDVDYAGLINDMSVANQGFTKERQQGRNPIMLEDICSVITRTSTSVSKYCGLAIPIRDLQLVLSQTVRDEHGTRNNMQTALTARENQYLKTLIRNISTGSKQERDALDTLRSNFAGGVLTHNIRVAIKQTASYFNAVAELGWKPMLRAAKDIPKSFGAGKTIKFIPGMQDKRIGWIPEGLPELEKRNALLWYRDKGDSSVEVSGQFEGGARVYGEEVKLLSFANDIGDVIKNLPGGDLIQWMDAGTVRTLEYAAKYYVDDHFKDLEEGSSEYWDKVSEVFSEAVERTQPNYTALQRAEYLRNGTGIDKVFGMFKTQPSQNFNVMYDAIGEFGARIQDYKRTGSAEAKAEKNIAAGKLANAISANVVSGIVFALMSVFGDIIIAHKGWKYKDDDDDKYDEQKIAKGLIEKFISSELSVMEFGSELYDIIAYWLSTDNDATYYGISNPSLEIIENVVEGVKDIKTATENYAGVKTQAQEKNWTESQADAYRQKYLNTIYKKTISFLGTISQATGQPLSNLYSNAESIVLFGKDISTGATLGTSEPWYYEDVEGLYTYDNLKSQIDSGGDIEGAVKELKDSGRDKSTIGSQITSNYKKELVELWSTDKTAATSLKQKLIRAYCAAGYTTDEANKRINAWFK